MTRGAAAGRATTKRSRTIAIVCDRIGKPRIVLPRVNSGLHGHYRSYFDEECRALFAQRFARDIEMFGYRY